MVERSEFSGVLTMAIMVPRVTNVTPMQSRLPGTALTYITIGAIMAVLAGTSYFFFDGVDSWGGYLRTSFLALGIILMMIGFAVGHIGREARRAEVPPDAPVNPTMQV